MSVAVAQQIDIETGDAKNAVSTIKHSRAILPIENIFIYIEPQL